MKRIYRWISLPLEICMILALIFGGWKLVEKSIMTAQGSLPSLWLLLFFVVSILFHELIRILGTLACGSLAGRKLVAIQIAKWNMVREKDRFCQRQMLPEQELFPIIMVREDERPILSWILYLLGGSICSLVLCLLSMWLLRSGSVSFDSTAGMLLFGLFFAGIIVWVLHAFPLYRAGQPNEALIFLQILFNKENAADLQDTFRLLRILSEDEGLPDEEPRPRPDDAFTFFYGYYLFHLYEMAVWKGDYEKAGGYLADLYLHRKVYPDTFQETIQEEAISTLALTASEEDLDVTDLFVTDQRRAHMETASSALSSRCLYLWTLHHTELSKERESYYKQSVEQLQDIPFKLAREGWMGILIDGQI